MSLIDKYLYAKINDLKLILNVNEAKGDTKEEIRKKINSNIQCFYDKLQKLDNPFINNISTSVELENIGKEFYIIMGEIAAKQMVGSQLAENCVSRFLSLYSLKNQYYCRAKIIQSILECEKAKRLNGLEKVHQLEKSISYLMEVFHIASLPANKGKYDFLIYNASVHYWYICRPLMRSHRYIYLIPSMNEVIDSLLNSSIATKEGLWVITYLVTLAKAYDDADGDRFKALEKINKANQMAKTLYEEKNQKSDIINSTKDLSDTVTDSIMESIFCLHIHLSRHKGQEFEKSLDNIRKSSFANIRFQALCRIQCVKSNIFNCTNIEKELLDILSLITVRITGLNKIDEELEIVQNSESSLIIELGILFYQHGFFDHVQRCEKIMINSNKNLKDHVKMQTEILRALLVSHTDSAYVNNGNTKLTKRKKESICLARRVECLKILERALSSYKRIVASNDDIMILDMVEKSVIISWNLSLVLLQPHLRKYIYRIFEIGLSLLDDIDSLHLGLRAKLHFEIGKCEMSSEFLAKALSHVTKALDFDYASEISSANKTITLAVQEYRFLDRFLVPLKTKLEIKSSLYKEANSLEEQVIIIIDQATESNEKKTVESLLMKAINLMEEGFKDQSSFHKEINIDEFKIISLWNDICKLSWHFKIVSLTKRAASHLINFNNCADEDFMQEKNYSLIYKQSEIIKAETCFLYSEVLMHEIKSQSEVSMNYKSPTKFKLKRHNKTTDKIKVENNIFEKLLGVDSIKILANIDGAENEKTYHNQNDLNSTLNTMKKDIINILNKASKIGKEIDEPFLIQNSMVYLWNYHIPLFRTIKERYKHTKKLHLNKAIFPELLDAFIKGFESMISAKSSEYDLICKFAEIIVDIHLLFVNNETYSINSETVIKIVDQAIQKSGTAKVKTLLHYRSILSSSLEASSNKSINSHGNNNNPVASTESKIFFLLQRIEDKNEVLKEKIAALEKSVSLFSEYENNKIEKKDKKSAENISFAEEEDEILEMELEILVRLGRGAFEMKEFQQCFSCLKKVIDKIPCHIHFSNDSVLDNLHENEVPCKIWRWVCLAEINWGNAVLMIVEQLGENHLDKKSSEYSNDGVIATNSDDKLLLKAAEHFVTATKYAYLCHSDNTVLSLYTTCGKLFWNASLKLVKSRSSLDKLTALALELLKYFKPIAAKYGNNNILDIECLVQIYCLLFDCLYYQKMYETGTKKVDEAFSSVTILSLQKPFWHYRILFNSKLSTKSIDNNRNNIEEVGSILMSMQDKNTDKKKKNDNSIDKKAIISQTKIWIGLARSSVNVSDRYQSYHKAIDLINNCIRDNIGLDDILYYEKMEYLIETGEWLYAEKYPGKYVQRYFYDALGIMNRVVDHNKSFYYYESSIRLFIMLSYLSTESCLSSLEFSFLALEKIVAFWGFIINEWNEKLLIEIYNDVLKNKEDEGQTAIDYTSWKSNAISSHSYASQLSALPSTVVEWSKMCFLEFDKSNENLRFRNIGLFLNYLLYLEKDLRHHKQEYFLFPVLKLGLFLSKIGGNGKIERLYNAKLLNLDKLIGLEINDNIISFEDLFIPSAFVDEVESPELGSSEDEDNGNQSIYTKNIQTIEQYIKSITDLKFHRKRLHTTKLVSSIEYVALYVEEISKLFENENVSAFVVRKWINNIDQFTHAFSDFNNIAYCNYLKAAVLVRNKNFVDAMNYSLLSVKQDNLSTSKWTKFVRLLCVILNELKKKKQVMTIFQYTLKYLSSITSYQTSQNARAVLQEHKRNGKSIVSLDDFEGLLSSDEYKEINLEVVKCMSEIYYDYANFLAQEIILVNNKELIKEYEIVLNDGYNFLIRFKKYTSIAELLLLNADIIIKTKNKLNLNVKDQNFVGTNLDKTSYLFYARESLLIAEEYSKKMIDISLSVWLPRISLKSKITIKKDVEENNKENMKESKEAVFTTVEGSDENHLVPVGISPLLIQLAKIKELLGITNMQIYEENKEKQMESTKKSLQYKKNVVEKWLEDTNPNKEPSFEEIETIRLNESLLYFQEAIKITNGLIHIEDENKSYKELYLKCKNLLENINTISNEFIQ